ncbi:MAG: glycosyltransferase, partial [Chloroflexota bacterium]|nr:glycosyltransferase [Chloroflexota bacterium]
MNPYGYEGPPVFGYETDTPLRRAAFICVHTSPLAALGQQDAGGMNVYVRDLACQLARLGLEVDIFTRRTDSHSPELTLICPGVRVINVTAGPSRPIDKTELFPFLPDFAAEAALFSLRQGVRYDVIHSHYWLSGWAAHLLRRYWDTPFVQMFHTTAHMKNTVAGSGNREPALRLQIERRLIQQSDSLIAANPAERADLIWRQHTATDKVCTV